MPVHGGSPPDAVVESVRSVRRGDGSDLAVHIRHPRDPGGPRPAVVLVHGGGWHESGPEMLDPYARLLAAQGYVTASPAYRLSHEALWPAQLHDVLSTVECLREHHRELGVNPDLLGLLGNSAGGHIAAMLVVAGADHAKPGTWSPILRSLRALVLLSPVVDVHDDVAPDIAEAAARLVGSADQTRLMAASPVANVSASMPPTLSVVGGADRLTPASAARAFHQRLDAAGVPNDLVTIEHGGHALELAPGTADRVSQVVGSFLARHLGAPPGDA